MIRVLVADDEPLVRERIRDLLGPYPELSVVAECADGASAADAILAERPELLFLDVQMPLLDGFEVLEAVAGEHLPAVVFVTAYDEHALRAFEFHALDYLLKPIDSERFDRTVRHALDLARRGEAGGVAALVGTLGRERSSRGAGGPQRIVARRGRRHVVLRPEEIEWVETAGNYLRVSTEAGECLLRGTMKALAARLDPERFVRIHRSVLVDAERIESLAPEGHGEYEVRLRGGKRFRSGRTYAAGLRRLLRS